MEEIEAEEVREGDADAREDCKNGNNEEEALAATAKAKTTE